MPPGSVLLESASNDGQSYVVEKRVMVSGDMLETASAGFDQNNSPAINFSLNSIGAKKFATVTGSNIGRPFAIILDNEVLAHQVIAFVLGYIRELYHRNTDSILSVHTKQ